MPSSLGAFCRPLGTFSGRFSDDCERFRAFWADPRIPSLLKLGVRADFSDSGDFNVLMPFVVAVSCGEGISIENVLSLVGSGNGRFGGADVVTTAVPAAECGESPVDDGDMV